MAVESLCSNSTLSDYEVFYDLRLGKGGFGEVYRAKRISSHVEVAIKVIEKKVLREKGMEKRIWDEVRIHQSLKHPRIVQMFECFQDNDCIYIVMELCVNGDLRKLLAKVKRLNEAHAADLLEQIIDGVLYLHNNKVIHRDLSASNIFLDKDYKVKIGDFGLATRLVANEKHNTMCGTPNFMAPEVAMKQPYGFEADVWSVGCLLYNMLTGHAPYGNDRQVSETLKRIVSSQVQIPDCVSAEAAALIRKLVRDAKDRLRLIAVKNEPFMLQFKKKNSHCSYTSTADSGRGTITTNGSTFSSGEHIYRSRSSERKSSRQGLPTSAPVRAFRTESTPRMPPQPLPSIVPVMYSVESKFSEPRHSTRSCERSTNGEHYCCAHSRLNEDNVCMKCHRMFSQHAHDVVASKNSCAHSKTASEFQCPAYEPENSRPPSVGSREKCRSYRENGVCGGQCTTKLNCPQPFVHTEEPCCSKDSYRHASPQALTTTSLIRDQRGRSLKDILPPLNTARLKPTKEETKKFTFCLLANGHVYVELKSNMNGVLLVSEVIGISGDGLKIVIDRPNCEQAERGSNSVPPIDWLSCEQYAFDSLPTKYWKLYQLAANFVNLLRGKTWKVKYCTTVGNYYLMENGNFEARFKNGKVAVKKKISSAKWASITCDEGIELNAEEISLVDSVLHNVCLIERQLEPLERDKLVDCCFPIIVFGCKATTCISNLSTEKENSRIYVAPVRSSVSVLEKPRKPLSESTNVEKPISQNKTWHVKKYKCYMTQLSNGGFEFSYEAGDKLCLLEGGNKLIYSSITGKSTTYHQSDTNLPSLIQEKLGDAAIMLKLIKKNR